MEPKTATATAGQAPETTKGTLASPKSLPDAIAVIKERDKTISERDKTIKELEGKAGQLEARIAWLVRQWLGRKSEKQPAYDPRWPDLFQGQFEDLLAKAQEESAEAEKQIPEEPKEERKRRRENRKMTEDLPVLAEQHYYPEGMDLSLYREMAPEVTYTVECEPGKLYRKALTGYTVKPGAKTVTVYDCRKRPIELQEVESEADNGDYYLKVKSPAKALKEQSMNRSFRKRFEDGMKAVAASLTKKGGTKKYEAVLKRIAKLEGRYPSIARYYSITVEKDGKNKATSVTWTVEVPDEEVFGTYFLRTNVRTLDEKTAWDYYNLIREIECSNRQLKTDLRSALGTLRSSKNLRPIYHQKDSRSDAHLFLGLLAYWIVNIIRHQLKKENEKRKKADPDPKAEYPTPYWTEIVDIMKSQKAVKSEAVNTLGEKVEMLICSTPREEAAEIYSMLNYKPIPFRKIKICRAQQT